MPSQRDYLRLWEITSESIHVFLHRYDNLYVIRTRSNSVSSSDPLNLLTKYHKLLASSALAASLHLKDFVFYIQYQSRSRSLVSCIPNKSKDTPQHIGSIRKRTGYAIRLVTRHTRAKPMEGRRTGAPAAKQSQ